MTYKYQRTSREYYEAIFRTAAEDVRVGGATANGAAVGFPGGQ
jgi:hypothetical protein